jgi:dihydroxyacetone kinase-like predicted kinase
VENLDQQVHDVREEARGPFGGHSPGASDRSVRPLAVVAVVAGDGFEAAFRDFGVEDIVRGGQSTNPSTGELLAAMNEVNAREILLLTNNPNVILAAQQVAGLAGRPVHVVPTRNPAEGLAAVLALDPRSDAAANMSAMTRAARQVQSVVVTEAVRDSTLGDRTVRRGESIALGPDDRLVAVHANPHQAVKAAIAAFRPGFELVTIYYGDGSSLADAEALAHLLRQDAAGIEVEVVHGGQPFYRYLVAAE